MRCSVQLECLRRERMPACSQGLAVARTTHTRQGKEASLHSACEGWWAVWCFGSFSCWGVCTPSSPPPLANAHSTWLLGDSLLPPSHPTHHALHPSLGHNTWCTQGVEEEEEEEEEGGLGAAAFPFLPSSSPTHPPTHPIPPHRWRTTRAPPPRRRPGRPARKT